MQIICQNAPRIKCQNTSQVYLSDFLLSDMSACMQNEMSENIPANMSDICRTIETRQNGRLDSCQMQRCKMSQIVPEDGQSQTKHLEEQAAVHVSER